ncbi:hypothetical protein CAK95_01580 [Pseudorhodoplanes sinuspersici]|uniref:Uncharacterized protein n=1 Tax=Pseudorhodoplanes sinuspersici TaxID=1235591 RepID=A0A1W6ZKN9_9HYPH|nr:hypothetical protein [Pseudorhodoplanes sinuspersici]ARP97911.1 hypothetical protein CAK95_01580 [Pseudorhodoplanes sinuspersici]
MALASSASRNPDQSVSFHPSPCDETIFRRFASSRWCGKRFFEKNDYDAYSVNSITGKKSADCAIDTQFGGCHGKIGNCLPITQGGITHFGSTVLEP